MNKIKMMKKTSWFAPALIALQAARCLAAEVPAAPALEAGYFELSRGVAAATQARVERAADEARALSGFPAGKLLAQARALQVVLNAFKRQWLSDYATISFFLPAENLEAYESLRRNLKFLVKPAEDGYVLIQIYGDDEKIRVVKDMKRYFYEVMVTLADPDGLDQEAGKIALWGLGTVFTYRMRSDPADRPDRRIDILTESEFNFLIRPRK